MRDVVVWYGLGEGIRDGVLKELSNGIKVLELGDGDAERMVQSVIDDFVTDYWPVSLENGAPARLALYFPNLETRDELRPSIESALLAHGIGPDTLLAVDNKSSEATRRSFEAVARDPAAPHRVLLLVNMGTEGWNCPSLFACALVRKLATSNNFVLQAATRCLRQVPGNTKPARVYLTASNKKTLEDQLTETYGTSLKALDTQQAERVEKTIHLHKPHLPALLIKKRVLRIQRKAVPAEVAPLVFTLPDVSEPVGPVVQTWSPMLTPSGDTRMQRLDAADVLLEPFTPVLDCYTAAARLAACHHLPTTELLAALRQVYETQEVPDHHMDALGQQIEAQRNQYEEAWDEIEVAVALVKADGFDLNEVNGQPAYTARISFDKKNQHLYKTANETADAAHALRNSFHYEGYNFDSNPEAEFLDWTLGLLQAHPHQIEGL